MSKQPSPDPLFTLRGNMDAIHSLFFQLNASTGDEHLYASTQAGLIHKWNLQSCRENSPLEVSQEACLAVKVSLNYLISQAKGGEIKMWQEEKGIWNPKTVINNDYWGFCKFDICRDHFLMCPESGSKINVLDFSGRIINTLCTSAENKLGEIMAVKCFALLGVDYIFVLYESGILTLFKNSGCKVSDLTITSDCPMALDFDEDSKGVVGSSGKFIVGFELTSDLQLMKWKEAILTNPGVSSVAIRPDKKLFAAGCWDFRVRLFSMKSLKLLAVLQNHTDTIQDVCYSPVKVAAFESQWLLAAAGKDGRITLWSLYNDRTTMKNLLNLIQIYCVSCNLELSMLLTPVKDHSIYSAALSNHCNLKRQNQKCLYVSI